MWSEAGDAQLSSWGLSREQAQQLGMWDVADAAAALPTVPHRPGIIIPYFRPDGQLLSVNGRTFGRVRWLGLPPVSAFRGKQKAPRYGQPLDTKVQVYFPRTAKHDWDAILNDHTMPLMITEGEAKAAVACLMGYNCVALGGVYSTHNEGKLVKVLADADWKSRDLVIVFDSDAATNPDVLAAEARLVEELGTQRQANVRIVRLPPDGDKKVGLDDFLNGSGPDELDKLIMEAPGLSALDAKCIALNRQVAWIGRESMLLELATARWIRKEHFTNGEAYASLKHIVRGDKSTKTISVAETWLKHPHAQRFSQAIFRPGEPHIVTDENGAQALNIWQGWNAVPGDVEPFLELDKHLYSKEPSAELRAMPLKLLAYKAQHPQEKVPLALVVTGPSGSGKTLWAECMILAFAPYSTSIDPGMLGSQFHPWLEKSVVGMINELDVPTMQKNSETLKGLITDQHRQLNDKFRPMRNILTPTFYCISSNFSGVGAGFGHDDRRILAFQAPPPLSKAFYDRIKVWKEGGGARHLMQYLLDMDLKGWRPPQHAPATAVKSLAYNEGLSPIQTLAADMRKSDFNSLLYWISIAEEWAKAQELSGDPKLAAQARAVLGGIEHIQIRPWYTAEELTLIFPTVLAQVYSNRTRELWTPGGLSRVLRDSGIPFLVNRDNPMGFDWQGRKRQYLVISQFSDWEHPIAQVDFERAMREWPTYGRVRQDMKRAAK